MPVSIPSRSSASGRTTRVYEFFDSRVLAHFWFIALSDGDEVQMMVPTFQSERAARVFERCVLEHPASALLSMDGQLELARRIERQLASGSAAEVPDHLMGGLPYESRPEQP
jgi:hypothetical protein